MYFNTIEEYNNYYKTLINNDKFEEHKTNNNKVYYTYKQFIIDVKFDIGDLEGTEDETCISETFEPFYKPPFYQIIGFLNNLKVQYDRPLILFDYKNDIIKYKNEIIKYIDDKEYENEGTESQNSKIV